MSEQEANSKPKAGEEFESILNQTEIDDLLGFDMAKYQAMDKPPSGLRALIETASVSYERLPMLEIVFDRMVKLASTNLRNFTSDNVEVGLKNISAIRFGYYLDSIPVPTILGIFRADQWDNLGLLVMRSELSYSMIDVLHGGRRIFATPPRRGRPFTVIEIELVKSVVELILSDASVAFEPVTPVTFELESIEINPKFAAITTPSNSCVMVEFSVEMEDRGGEFQLILPYATIEPIREKLMQTFMGEKFGSDPIWENHLASEIYHSTLEVEAVLYEGKMPLNSLLNLEQGQVIMFDTNPDNPLKIKREDQVLTTAIMGQLDDKISVKVNAPLKVTLEQHEEVIL